MSLLDDLSRLTPDERRSLLPALRRRQAELQAARASSAAPFVIQPLDSRDDVPLAPLQEKFWLAQTLTPSSAADNIVTATRLRGPLSPRHLWQASAALIDRHEVLRTSFPVVDGEPRQRIVPRVAFSPIEEDFSAIPPAERERHVLARTTAFAHEPFALDRAPLFRVLLLRLDEHDHILVTNVHHVVCDVWSSRLLTIETAELYAAAVEGRPARLPALDVQYADFAVAHRRWIASAGGAEQAAYWKRQLAGLVVHDMPTDRPRVSGPTRDAAATRALSPAVLDGIRQLARAERTTPFTVLLAALSIVLARHTAQPDVVVGTPVANRTSTQIETMAGVFVNTLVLRADLSGHPTARGLIGQLRQTSIDALNHQSYPLEQIVADLRPAREVGRASPFFQVLFNVQTIPPAGQVVSSLTSTPVRLAPPTTPFDLAVSIDLVADPRVVFSYDAALFDAETADRLIAEYERALAAIVAQPDVLVDDIDLMSEADRTLVLRTWNATERAVPAGETVVEWIHAQMARSPDAPALRCGGESLRYGELAGRVDHLAAALVAHGAGPTVTVGIHLDRSIDMVVAVLGVMRAGAAYVPLDPTLPAERRAFMARDAGIGLILTRDRLASAAAIEGARLLSLDAVDRAGPVEPAFVPPRVKPDDLAYVLYTSGSTGTPKGVAVPHGALANVIHSLRDEPGIRATDRLLAVTSLAFDIAGLELLLPLTAGAEVVVATAADTADPRRLAATIDQAAITIVQATPATWRMLIDAGWHGSRRLTVLCGGEAMSRDLADALLARAGAVWNLYGPTETTIWSTIERVQPGEARVSIGRPIANTQVYVLDERGRPVPVGAPGELCIGGAGVARGYLGRPDLTADRFVPDRFSQQPGARLYRTGDRARFRNDGRLDYLGRLDTQVKLRGFRIELGEVEAALASHPDVSQAAAVARPGPDGEPALAAYVVPRTGASIDVDALRTTLRSRLPAYMVPAAITVLAAMPLTTSGKIDRAALPDPAVPAAAPATVAMSPLEQTIAGVFANVLHAPHVGPDDDFFELGGHSLLAVRLMSDIESASGLVLPLATLFEARTPRQIAAVIETGSAAAPAILVPLQKAGTKPPVFCVHGIGGEVLVYSALAARMAPDRPFVGICSLPIDERESPFQTIEEQAARYLREVVRAAPEGPYYLGGYSHGGRVALEMALQLEAMGKPVAFIGIFDTTPMATHSAWPLYVARLAWNVPKWLWYDGLRTPWAENRERLARNLGTVGRRLAAFAPTHRRDGEGRRRPALEATDIMSLDNLPDRYRRRYLEDFRAFIAYRPSRRCRSVTLFRAIGQPILGSHEPDLGWHLASDRVDVRHVPGNHSSILEPPWVDRLARELQAALDDAQRRAGDLRGLNTRDRASGASPGPT
jgi:amino acid adenylation domain-containing protein